MKELWAGIRSFMMDDEGATATEYAVMLALIIAVAIATIVILGERVENAFNRVADAIQENAGS